MILMQFGFCSVRWFEFGLWLVWCDVVIILIPRHRHDSEHTDGFPVSDKKIIQYDQGSSNSKYAQTDQNSATEKICSHYSIACVYNCGHVCFL